MVFCSVHRLDDASQENQWVTRDDWFGVHGFFAYWSNLSEEVVLPSLMCLPNHVPEFSNLLLEIALETPDNWFTWTDGQSSVSTFVAHEGSRISL